MKFQRQPKIPLPKSVLKKARDMGVSSFHVGKMAAVHDSALMNLIRDNKGGASQLLEEWNNGYHSENLKTPVANIQVQGRMVVAVPFMRRRVGPLPEAEEKNIEGIKWVSASRPIRKRFTGGGEKWVTTLTGTRNGHDFNVNRALVDARNPQPTEVVIDGKKLRWS